MKNDKVVSVLGIVFFLIVGVGLSYVFLSGAGDMASTAESETGEQDAVEEGDTSSDESAEVDEGSDDSAGLANPASVYCYEEGGDLLMYENEEGISGYCQFADGSICEEWAYFRSEGKDCTEPGQDANLIKR